MPQNMLPADPLLSQLSNQVRDDSDTNLARDFAPILYFDEKEPFLPLAVGHTVFRSPDKSPSSKFTIDPEDGIAIEYAIWWDWDIQHLYELEHVWVYLDADKQIVKVEASAHGQRFNIETSDGSIPMEDDRIAIFSESGKHGFAAEREWLINREQMTIPSCGERAGNGGIHTSNPFGAERLGNPTAFEHRLAKRYMQSRAFTPTFAFTKLFDLRTVPFVTWAQLSEWIPKRIIWWREQLPQVVPHLQLICLDCGDTLVDEATEVKPDGETVITADMIPDADTMLHNLVAEGYLLALVADGPRATFENVLKHQYQLWDIFSAYAISGDVGVHKPDKRMFLTVLDELNIPSTDYHQVAMVGNNLARDIKGANDLGLISIWMSWSPRRSKIPADKSEQPDYSIESPSDLLAILEKIELNLAST